MGSAGTSAHTRRLIVALLIAAVGGLDRPRAAAPASPFPIVQPNDNRRAAGTLEHGTLTLALRAGLGRWQPEGAAGPALQIEAFGEVGSSLMVPAPLIRVVEGTRIVVSIRNEL